MGQYDELVKKLRVCSEVNSLSLYKRGLMKQAADAIEELSAYEKLYEELTDKGQKTARKLIDAYPRWISVEERLPEYGKPVLLYFNRNNHNSMGVGDCYHDGDTLIWRGCGFIPTHWMPLPEPPKEEP